MQSVNSLVSIVAYLNGVLHPERFSNSDRCINGLQLDASSTSSKGRGAVDLTTDIRADIKTVAVAVDPGCSVIERAIEGGAQLLILHHGLLYGDLQPLVGPLGRRIARCFEAGLSVYASHLPLDNHIEVGNAGLMAKGLDLQNVSPFLEYRGVTIGVSGALPVEKSRDEIIEATRKMCGDDSFLSLNFGRRSIKTIAIASGAAAMGIPEAFKQGADLFITGETSQAAYHDAKDLGMNVIFAGHYNTETFGVKKLGELLEAKFKVKSLFIDEPTGI